MEVRQRSDLLLQEVLGWPVRAETPWSMDTRGEEPRFLRPWFRTLQRCEEYLFAQEVNTPLSCVEQRTVRHPGQRCLSAAVSPLPDAPLSLSKFQARQLFYIVLARLRQRAGQEPER